MWSSKPLSCHSRQPPPGLEATCLCPALGKSDLLTFHPGDAGCRAGRRQAEQGGRLSLQQHLVLEFDVEDWGEVWRESTQPRVGGDPSSLTDAGVEDSCDSWGAERKTVSSRSDVERRTPRYTFGTCLRGKHHAPQALAVGKTIFSFH